MRVLIVKTSSMGDVIHTFPAVEDARRERPDIRFDWCVEEAFAPIVALHPAIGTIHRTPIRRWRKAILSGTTWREVSALRRALRDGRYDLVLDAQGLMKSALVAKLAGSPVAGLDRASAREPVSSLLYARKFAVARDMHAIERTRRLFGLALGYHPDLATLDSGIVPPPTTRLPEDLRTAFLLHGTSREDKKWPVSDWIEMARLLVARGLTPVTTWSSPAEQGVAQAIAAAVPETRLIAKSPLGEVAGLIGRSTLVVGADTGLTHLASAFGLPTVAVFLTTEPGLTGPRGNYATTLLAPKGGTVSADRVMLEAEALMARRGSARPSH